MVILSNGFKLPETGDFGDVWFPALEDNIQRTNDHNHDGNNSSRLQASSIDAIVQNIISANFSPSGSEFVAPVTLAGGNVDIDKKHVIFRDPTTKEPIYLRYEKVSNIQINVFSSYVGNFEVLII